MINPNIRAISSGKNRKNAAVRGSAALQRCAIETLENRTMMTTSVWTGAGADANFSTPGNWQGNTVPTTGGSVSFPASATSKSVTVDTNISLGSITIGGAGYDITGLSISFNGGLVDTGNSEIVSSLTLGGSQSVNVSSGTLVLGGVITDGGSAYGITKSGAGTLDLTASSTYTGITNISTGVLQVDGRITSTVHLYTATTLDGNGRVGSILSSGGTTMPGLNYTAGLLGDSGTVTLNSASTLSFELDGNTAGTGNYYSSQLATGGNVALGGATLSVALGPDYTPAIGDYLTLISNSGSTTTGSFAGLPQGSLITLGGHYVFRISYTAGNGHDTAISFVRATTVTLGTTIATSVIGQPVTFTATVAPTDGQPGTPTGTVTFYDNGSAIGSAVTLDGNGQATLTDSALLLGNNTITASYGGATGFQTATSAELSQSVSAAATSTTLISSSSSTVWGQSVTFTATISVSAPGSGTATGTVQFYASGNPIGSPVTLSAGSASYSTSALAVGSQSITADFVTSTGNYTGSTSTVLTQTISQSTSTTSISSSGLNSVVGQSVTFTATITPAGNGAGVATGLVTFMDGGTVIGNGNLSGAGIATFTTTALVLATHSITAVYSGDGNFLTSISAAASQIVSQAGTTISVSTPSPQMIYDQATTLNASVTAMAPGNGTPTGSVTFSVDGNVIGTVNLANGTASISAGILSTGVHSFSANYSGDTDFVASSSNSGSQTIADASSTITVFSTAINSVWGQSVTLSALPAGIGSGALTGLVAFFDGVTQIGTRTFDGTNPVAITVSGLAVGSHSITAVFGGTPNYLGSTSAILTQVVAKADATTSLSSSATSLTLGADITLTAIITGVSAITGSVDFYDGTTPLGTGTVTGGIATLANVSLLGGSHSITAIYQGDTHFNASTSAAELIDVASAGILQFGAATYSVNETSGTATIPVTRIDGLDGAVEISYSVTGGTAVNDVDFTLSNGTLNFADGQSSATITVGIINDGKYGSDKTVVFSLTSPAGGVTLGAITSTTLNISDNNTVPTLSVSNPIVTEAADGTAIATFTVTLSSPADVVVNASYTTEDGSVTAASGSYISTSGQLVFAPGITTQTVSVNINGTNTPGVNQTFNLALAGASNAAVGDGTGTATIVNNNFADPTATSVSSFALPGSGAVFTPLSSDSSNDGGPLTLSIDTAPAYGIASLLTVNGVQEIAYTPGPGAIQSDTFTYLVTDSHGDSSTATATVLYQGVGLVVSPLNPKLTDLAAIASTGNDTIKFAMSAKKVKVTFNGANSGTFAPTGRIIAMTGTGNDVVTAAGVSRSVWFYGGSGSDTFTGGTAADVLIGGTGANSLNGGAGRNILIAGSGPSTLKSAGTDIMVAGTTVYDSPAIADQAALNAVLTTWGVHSKAAIAQLKTSPAALNASTVTGNNFSDVLNGNTSTWFFGNFTFAGGVDTFADGRKAKKGHLLVPTTAELVTTVND